MGRPRQDNLVMTEHKMRNRGPKASIPMPLDDSPYFPANDVPNSDGCCGDGVGTVPYPGCTDCPRAAAQNETPGTVQ